MITTLKIGETVEQAIEDGLVELGLSRDQVTVEVIQEPESGFLGLFGKKDAVVRVSKKDDISGFVSDILQKPEKEEPKKPIKSQVENIQEEIEDLTVDIKSTTEKIEKSVETDLQEDIKKVEESVEEVTSKEEDTRDIWDDITTKNKAEEFLSAILDEMDIDYSLIMDIEDNVLNIEVKTADQSELGIVIGKRGSTLDALQHLVSLVINGHREGFLRVSLDANNYRNKRIKTLEEIARRGADRVFKTGRDYRLDPMNGADRRIVHLTLQDYEYIETESEGRDPHRRVIIKKI